MTIEPLTFTIKFDLNKLYPREGRPKKTKLRNYHPKWLSASKIQCVYFLFYKEVIVYIGETNNLHHRIAQHLQTSKMWNYYSWIVEENKNKRLALEALLIEEFKPKYNKKGI